MRKKRIERARRQGMTLVELLVTILIGGIVMGAVSLLFVAFFRNFNMQDDLAEAQQNGEMGLTLIETYVLQAGMGMPSLSSADFQAAFDIAPTPAWQKWNGPISVDSAGTALEVLSARSTMPTVGSMEEKSIGTSGTYLSVAAKPPFSGGASLRDLVSQGDWIVFPASDLPFRVISNPTGNTSIQLQCANGGTVYLFDVLCILRSVNFHVDQGKLVLSGGEKTEIPGIARMYVQWDDSSRLLRVVLLARGKERQNHMLPSTLPGWPGELAGDERHYRHVAVGKTWRIRN